MGGPSQLHPTAVCPSCESAVHQGDKGSPDPGGGGRPGRVVLAHSLSPQRDGVNQSLANLKTNTQGDETRPLPLFFQRHLSTVRAAAGGQADEVAWVRLQAPESPGDGHQPLLFLTASGKGDSQALHGELS